MDSSLEKIITNIPSTVSEYAPVGSIFTTRLQIVYNNSDIIISWDNSSGESKPNQGDFWLGPPGGSNLGTQFVGIPMAIRDHALQLKGTEVSLESYNRAPDACPPKNEDQEIFSKIEGSPKQQDKKLNRWGVDCLIWIPEKKQFAIVFLHSTGRQAIPHIRANMGKHCKIISRKTQSQNFTWFIPEFREIKDLTTLDPSKDTYLPNNETVIKEVTLFKNPIPKARENTTDDGRVR